MGQTEMTFSFQGYINLMKLLRNGGYEFCSYHNWENVEKCVILRHDIDYDPRKAVEMAEVEYKEGIGSTYFVLLTSDFYNTFSKSNSECLKKIQEYGHEIGLHFDEVRYTSVETNLNEVKNKILEEANHLEQIIGTPVKVVSMHRPSRMVLESNLNIPGMENSYGSRYFKEFKYLSDSRRHWREPVEKLVLSGEYRRLHILTHSFWYDKEEKDINRMISGFVNSGNKYRYETMRDNITDLESIMNESEVVK